MSGQTLRLLRRQALDFSFLDKNGSQTRVLVGKIPTSQYTIALLLVRFHNVSIAGGQVDVMLVNDASTEEDPDHTFLGTAALSGSSVTVDSTTTVGDFSLAKVSGTFGSMVALLVKASQDGVTGQAPLMAEISVDLILKSN